MSALGSVALVQVTVACWDFSDTATQPSCPTSPWLFPELRQEHSSTRQPTGERSISNVGIKRFVFCFFLLTGHRMVYGAEESKTKLFPLQT